MLDRLSDEQKWQAVSLGSAVLAAVMVRGAIKGGWRIARDESPPLNPLREDSSWSEALLFSLATGLTVGLARMGARAIATATWDRTHAPRLLPNR